MKFIWDKLMGILVSLFAVYLIITMIFELVTPYVPFVIIGGLLFLLGRSWIRYSRNW